MTSIKQAEMKANLQRDERTAATLSKAFQTLLKASKNSHETHKQLAASLDTVSENEATSNLKKLFEEVSTTLKNVNKSQENYVRNRVFL